MTVIALIHLLWLLLLPAGLFFCVRGLEKRGYVVLGVCLVMLSFPALLFLRYLWPFDFLWPAKVRILAKAEQAGWKVELTQTPGSDFYFTEFVITSPEGWINRVCYDADDSKWWRTETMARSNRLYFLRSAPDVGRTSSYLDPERRIFWSGYYQREERLVEPDK